MHSRTDMRTARQHAEPRTELDNENTNTNRTRHHDVPVRTEQSTEPIPTEGPQKAPSTKGQRRRDNINVGSLNINGLRTSTENNSEFRKWTEVNTTMKKERIVILAVQETHLDEPSMQEIHRAFGKRMEIHNSQPENNPRMSAGGAFVLNKELIRTDKVKTYELIKGRVIAMKLTWLNDEEATLINVYAPNRRGDHEDFWKDTLRKWEERHQGRPDFVLGDFNVTEEMIDRNPAKQDNTLVTKAIREFRLAMGICDQWRHMYPKAREYTYRTIINGKPIKSRLDRIYVNKEKAPYTFDWSITPSSIPTDHWLVTLKYAPKGAPYIGKGRWTWPLRTLKEERVIKGIVKEGMKLQQDLDNLR